MMEEQSRRGQVEDWAWGRFMSLEMLHPLGRSGGLKWILSIGPKAQAGTGQTVKQTGRSFGAPMRFVADLSDPDKSLITISAGESGQWSSEHYQDQFPAWWEGKGLASAFSNAAWEKAKVKTLVLLPAGTK
jgi:penicillin amidase